MREDLAELNGLRRRFQGVFVRFGEKSGYKEVLTTILLKDIINVASGKTVTDHLWFTMGKGFEKLGLKKDDIVRFDARVTTYYKGYKGRRHDNDFESFKPVELDYRLSFPTKFVRMAEGGETELVRQDEGLENPDGSELATGVQGSPPLTQKTEQRNINEY